MPFQLPLFTFFILQVQACLPGYGLGYPAYSGYYARPFVGGLPAFGGLPPVPVGPHLGPFRAQANTDKVNHISVLNCASFNDNCKWSNTNEEELDWATVKALPQSQNWMGSLEASVMPEEAAGALISGQRRGWEGGQLVSDEIPCLPSGVMITLTAWKSRVGNSGDQPRLQVCSRNIAESRLPLVNCNEILIRNGIPTQTNVPPPSNPSEPAQIVIYGNNFVATAGGALFVQNIELNGELTCNEATVDKHPTLIEHTNPRSQNTREVGPLKAFDSNVIGDIEAFEDIPIRAPPPPSFELSSSLFEQCLSLSCNPSDLSCKFWRSSGNNRWEIGSAGRVANPLTGINSAPGTAKKFLVAPFVDAHINSYTLVTEKLNIPLTEEVYFCFYEYLATSGLSLSICTDRGDCFYRHSQLNIGSGLDPNAENTRWSLKCARLPIGIYELRVIAENMGDNKGDVGFLPVRLSKDDGGRQFIC